jgi:oligopeptide/dipeptide ABC transporter ATP-binding protein
MNTILRVRDLTTTFETERGIAHAVDGVSFDLYKGETLGIVGESGCGKTVTGLSLLRLIEKPGSIAPQSVIEFEGRDLMQLTKRELRQVRGARLAMVFQEPGTSLNPVLTVGSQIAETMRAHEEISRQEAQSRTEDLLEMVGLPEPRQRIDDYPHQLSGGMQQRVMIAMALSCKPSVLIADEPTTALDVTIQAQILDLLTDLKERLGMAMILITHDLGIVAGVAERVAVMYGGQLVEQAPTRALFGDPMHPYTQGLMRSVPRIEGRADRLATVPGTVPPATHWPPACRFHPRCQHAWERCSSEMPHLTESGQDHIARCWLTVEPGRSDK